MSDMRDLIKLMESFDGEYVTKKVVGHKDNESRMMQRELTKIRDYAEHLIDVLDQFPDGDFPHWWQAKLVLAGEYMSTIKHFLEGEMELGPRSAPKDTVSSDFDMIDLESVVNQTLGEDEGAELGSEPVIDGQPVDMNSVVFGDVYRWDHPDYVDAYPESASFMDGTPLTDEQLDRLESEFAYELYQELLTRQVEEI
jgi:hypothetical protein